jgi:ATP-dependent 26S proteasome regulatory subunit
MRDPLFEIPPEWQLTCVCCQDDIKVIAATNRIDILDPALLRSGRLDRKIEFPAPTEEARARIMQIHARSLFLPFSLQCFFIRTGIHGIVTDGAGHRP